MQSNDRGAWLTGVPIFDPQQETLDVTATARKSQRGNSPADPPVQETSTVHVQRPHETQPTGHQPARKPVRSTIDDEIGHKKVLPFREQLRGFRESRPIEQRDSEREAQTTPATGPLQSQVNDHGRRTAGQVQSDRPRHQCHRRVTPQKSDVARTPPQGTDADPVGQEPQRLPEFLVGSALDEGRVHEHHDGPAGVRCAVRPRRGPPTRRSCPVAVSDADRAPTSMLRWRSSAPFDTDRCCSSTGHHQRCNDSPEKLHGTIVAVWILTCTSRGAASMIRFRIGHSDMSPPTARTRQ